MNQHKTIMTKKEVLALDFDDLPSRIYKSGKNEFHVEWENTGTSYAFKFSDFDAAMQKIKDHNKMVMFMLFPDNLKSNDLVIAVLIEQRNLKHVHPMVLTGYELNKFQMTPAPGVLVLKDDLVSMCKQLNDDPDYKLAMVSPIIDGEDDIKYFITAFR